LPSRALRRRHGNFRPAAGDVKRSYSAVRVSWRIHTPPPHYTPPPIVGDSRAQRCLPVKRGQFNGRLFASRTPSFTLWFTRNRTYFANLKRSSTDGSYAARAMPPPGEPVAGSPVRTISCALIAPFRFAHRRRTTAHARITHTTTAHRCTALTYTTYPPRVCARCYPAPLPLHYRVRTARPTPATAALSLYYRCRTTYHRTLPRLPAAPGASDKL